MRCGAVIVGIVGCVDSDWLQCSEVTITALHSDLDHTMMVTPLLSHASGALSSRLAWYSAAGPRELWWGKTFALERYKGTSNRGGCIGFSTSCNAATISRETAVLLGHE